jgi:hypothetical protein
MSNWAATLTPAQRRACTRIMDAHAGVDYRAAGAHHGFTVFMIGTVGPPRYLELRLHAIDGRLLGTWVIEDNRV